MFILSVRTGELGSDPAAELGGILGQVSAALGRGSRGGDVRNSVGAQVGSWFLDDEDPGG